MHFMGSPQIIFYHQPPEIPRFIALILVACNLTLCCKASNSGMKLFGFMSHKFLHLAYLLFNERLEIVQLRFPNNTFNV